ncbi:hypothetical protein GCM10010869_21290 [Mesorhizobium tianshanense]|nr:hypothetical protein GCM10010869_21290 [Mesorhizobium tianshanense]
MRLPMQSKAVFRYQPLERFLRCERAVFAASGWPGDNPSHELEAVVAGECVSCEIQQRVLSRAARADHQDKCSFRTRAIVH